jgi:enterochelin esterase-like enzyme
LDTTLLPYPLEYQIYLPPCYTEMTEHRYPVLYLLHGQTYTDQQWIRLGVPQVLDRLIASGESVPFLVVMPGERYWQQPDDTHFDEALTGVLIPYVDQSYRTIPDRQHRAIGGLSRGGGWAIHLGLKRWELFGALGAHSPAIFWLDDKHLEEWLAAIPPESLPRIYVDSGDNDKELKTTLAFEQLLTKEGIPHEWHLFTGFHNETYWRAHVEDYLRWYAGGW